MNTETTGSLWILRIGDSESRWFDDLVLLAMQTCRDLMKSEGGGNAEADEGFMAAAA